MAIAVNNLTAGYGPITVLRDLSFAVEPGSILGVLGRNGMGKSTLIRTLAGLIQPSVGTISFDGKALAGMSAHQRARLGITTVVQGRGMFPKLSVRENLEMGRIAAGGSKRNRLDEVFSYFPRLQERLNQAAGTLSGGEQQMLAIGRGLMTDPKLMLLDEPSDGIMPALVQQIADILVAINRNERMTVVIVEQNVPMLFRMTDRFIILEKGTIVASGTKEQVAKSEVMQEYLAI